MKPSTRATEVEVSRRLFTPERDALEGLEHADQLLDADAPVHATHRSFARGAWFETGRDVNGQVVPQEHLL